MILATRDDIDYPHIDWVCDRGQCGSVYASAGKPDTDHCVEGHEASWRPNDDQLEAYIDLLESLEVGDGVLFAADGPAPLMAPVAEVGDNFVITESIDSPARKIRWRREPSADAPDDDLVIEQMAMNSDYELYDRVYHVDTVEIRRSESTRDSDTVANPEP